VPDAPIPRKLQDVTMTEVTRSINTSEVARNIFLI